MNQLKLLGVAQVRFWLMELFVFFVVSRFVAKVLTAHGWGACAAQGGYPGLGDVLGLLTGLWLLYWLLQRLRYPGALYARLFEPPMMGIRGGWGFRKPLFPSAEFGHSIRAQDRTEYVSKRPADVLIEVLALVMALIYARLGTLLPLPCLALAQLAEGVTALVLLGGMGAFRLIICFSR